MRSLLVVLRGGGRRSLSLMEERGLLMSLPPEVLIRSAVPVSFSLGLTPC